MVGTARTRSRVPILIIGSSNKNGYHSIRRALGFAGKTCTDVIGNIHGENPLDIVEKFSNDAVFNGWNGKTGIGERRYVNYRANFSWPAAPIETWNYGDLVTKLMARTNPGTSRIKLPVFLFELHEFPRLFLLAGRGILKKAANANLAWQFGWKPLLGDLARMFEFQKSVHRRVQELERLQSKSGLRRRMTLETDDTTSTDNNKVIESYVKYHTARMSTRTVKKAWGTIRWIPAPHRTLPQTDLERVKYAQRLVLGLTPGNLTDNIWEGLPWSWLIDWFSNVGDFIQASNNSVAVPAGRVNLMSHCTATRTYVTTSQETWDKQSPHTSVLTTVTKERIQQWPVPSVSVSLPFLTGRQLSILGSLKIQKSRLRF